mmetsp:Transcript_3947/g.5669  ORF Transcript_3947/g.5669 Transcript_3947/m.5669 type:complete len:296 (-) Transcript_3947:414-1301(-)
MGNKSNRLLHACRKGNVDDIQKYLAQGISVNYRGKHGKTPLIVAAMGNKTSVIKLLLSQGARVDATDNQGNKAITLACRFGHLNAVRQLVAGGARFTAIELCAAAEGGHVRTIKYILDQKQIDVNTKLRERGRNGSTALHCAAHHGNPDAVEYLILKKANVRMQNVDGNEPIHLACSSKTESKGRKGDRRRVVELLLAADAEVNAKNAHGNTPLTLSILSKNENLSKFLISVGAGSSPFLAQQSFLDQAVKKSQRFQAMRLKAKFYEPSLCKIRRPSPEYEPATAIGPSPTLETE